MGDWWGRPRVDALLVLGAGRCSVCSPASPSAWSSTRSPGPGRAGVVDAGAVQGAGGGWAGGYLELAALLALVAAASAAAIQGIAAPAAERGASAPASAPLPAPLRHVAGRLAGDVARALAAARRGVAALASVDRWLVTQPGLVVVVAGAALCLVIFR